MGLEAPEEDSTYETLKSTVQRNAQPKRAALELLVVPFLFGGAPAPILRSHYE